MLRLRVGNTYERLSEDEAVPARSAPECLKVHKWRLFVEAEGGDDRGAADLSRIREVEFFLHESFSPQSYVKHQTPFSTTQTSYAGFTATVVIRFFHAPEVRHEHHLVFEEGGSSDLLVLRAGPAPTLGDVEVPDLCFGTELELLIPERNNLDEEAVAAALQRAGIPCRAEGYTHRIVEHWKLVHDSSLSCSSADPNCLKFELVSPILRGADGIDALEVVIRELQTLGVTVNKSCALHVHVDARQLTQRELTKICAQFIKYEEAFDLIMPRSRTGNSNQYARSNRADNFNITDNRKLNNHILSRRRKQGLQKLLNPKGRYYKLNLQRLTQESPTLEFRQHAGTCNFEKVRAWVLLLLFFCQNSARLDAPDNFQNSRCPGYKFDRLFRWVIQSPLLHAHYTSRAWSLMESGKRSLDEARLWTCSCKKTFARCSDYMQHKRSTQHHDPSCCDSCGGH